MSPEREAFLDNLLVEIEDEFDGGIRDVVSHTRGLLTLSDNYADLSDRVNRTSAPARTATWRSGGARSYSWAFPFSKLTRENYSSSTQPQPYSRIYMRDTKIY